jgi:hypothetical protein
MHATLRLKNLWFRESDVDHKKFILRSIQHIQLFWGMANRLCTQNDRYYIL